MKFSKSIQLTSNARRCALTTVSIVALLGCASAALADEAAAGSDLEEVVVTGSRIARDGFDTPTPVNVLGAQEIAASAPANIADFVNTLPSVAGSITAANSSGSLSNGAAGISALNVLPGTVSEIGERSGAMRRSTSGPAESSLNSRAVFAGSRNPASVWNSSKATRISGLGQVSL